MKVDKLIWALILILVPASTLAQHRVWERHAIDTSSSGADGVRIADINNDQLMDIVTGWEEGGLTKVYLHPGNDQVRQLWPSVVVGQTPSVEDAVFVDLDDNGVMDVVSSTEGKNNKIYVHWAPGHTEDYLEAAEWRTQVLPASDGLMQWMFACPAQIDGHYGIDLVAGAKNREAAIGWFQAPAKTTPLTEWEWHAVGPATWVMSLIAKDMDHDGDLDIVTSDRKPGASNGVRWLENPGQQSLGKREWKNHFIGARGLEVMFMDMADLNEDDLEDAIVTEYTSQKIVFMQRLDSSGLHWKSHYIDIPQATGRAKAVKVGDINGDGQLDLVHSSNTLANEGKVGVIWMSFKQSPTDPEWEWFDISGPEGYKFDRIELLDLDGDGDLDVLTCEENYGKQSQGLGVIWYENPYGKGSVNR